MIHPGLVSVTFRQLTPRQIIDLVQQTRLECIEWGGDIHVPHGDVHKARQVGEMTKAAGLRVSSYGSYYRVWPREPVPFDLVLETAVALGAPVIRVWAGKLGSAQAGEDHWKHVIRESREIARKADQEGIGVAFEYHPNTLTDTQTSALRLLREADHPNLFSYWQAPVNETHSECLAGINSILPWLWNLHVYAWKAAPPGQEQASRLALVEAERAWIDYFQCAAATGQEHDALLEFVKDDSPELFLQDADELLRLLKIFENG